MKLPLNFLCFIQGEKKKQQPKKRFNKDCSKNLHY